MRGLRVVRCVVATEPDRTSRKGVDRTVVVSPDQRMGARASVIVGLVCLGVASMPGIATACMPPPRLPDESPDAFYARLQAEDEARALRFQQELWSRADRVFTARVEFAAEHDGQSGSYRLRRRKLPKPPKVMAPVPPMYGQRETSLLVTPVAELKGVLPARAFMVTQQASWSSCGPVYTFNDVVGEMVMKALKALDDVAYVRYASVYRDFRHTDDFAQFLNAEGLSEDVDED